MNRRPLAASTPATWPSLCARFAQAFAPDRYARLGIVVAVSGGADSVALLRLLCDVWDAAPPTARRHLIVAHFNHALRGEHADADQRFVAELADSLGLDFVTEACQSAPRRSEESLRDLRYEFLHRTVAARGARCLLTAHTADDQVETVLHHLFRGTGPAGLCGIPAVRPLGNDFVLLRPLLNFSGAELRAGLVEIGQSWREDHSNTQVDYQRNWIRGHLLPLIRSRYATADESILRLVASQSQWHETLRREAQRWVDQRAAVGNDQVRIARGAIDPALFSLAMTLIWDQLGWPRQALAAAHYQTVAALVSGQQHSAVTLPGAIRAEASEDEVRIGRR